MRLKTFSADTMPEALEQVRAEMGPDAIIISSYRGKRGGFFVRAALDEPALDAQAEQVAAQLHAPQPAIILPDLMLNSQIERQFHDSLVRRIRGEAPLQALKASGFDRAELLSLLRSHRTPDHLAHRLAQAAEQSGLADMTLALASALDGMMRNAPLLTNFPKLLMLLGPPGAGKTSIAGKLAAHARLAGKSVTLVAGDTEGAGAVARLETFANHLGARLALADSPEAFEKAAAHARLAEDRLTIFDMAGFDARSPSARQAMAATASLEEMELAAVVSATWDAEDLAETVQALAGLRTKYLFVTGVDLTRRMGGLLAAVTSGLPLGHITRSAFIAGGLETPSPLSLARCLLKSTSLDPDRGSKS